MTLNANDQDLTSDSPSPVKAEETQILDQRAEAAKAIRFMAVKAAIFILIPVIASALAVFFLL
ncbi:phosphoribosylformylglycinamidine synthase-associated small membrane protein [Cohaesibacter intestini]|uniref:phosphoribosylformylglycinamidine synthase-associated small membrane protein n=1 Tax=Cohaesibacter intestini TaxID=2211145 RepID=UPI000DEA8601|nr:phosphoribosylformylglycinamidine synthase-associated small membrane protein [Cohaesibacter intestini]